MAARRLRLGVRSAPQREVWAVRWALPLVKWEARSGVLAARLGKGWGLRRVVWAMSLALRLARLLAAQRVDWDKVQRGLRSR